MRARFRRAGEMRVACAGGPADPG